MQPVLSIVIPVYRERAELPALLGYLAACRGTDKCEIVVVDGDDGSSATPDTILPVSVVNSPAGRAVQLNTGALLSSAPNLLFLHADTRPPRTFVSRITETLDHYVAGAFDLAIDSSSPVVRLIGYIGRIRSRITRVPYGDQAHFMRREIFEEIGGYPEIPIMEDLRLMEELKNRGLPIRICGPVARTSGRRWHTEGAFRTTMRNWRLQLAYNAGVSPYRLAASYRPQSELHTHVRVPWRFKPAERVLLFHRSLRPEGVMTRLAAGIGTRAALACYRAMLADLKRELRPLGRRLSPWVDSSAGRSVFRHASIQHGRDLWDRMARAFDSAFSEGAERVVLIGSDVPSISYDLVSMALAALRTHDAVLGPSRDGGYYLIGFARPGYLREVFDAGRAAATRRAAAQATIAWLREAGLRVSVTRELIDVDTSDDLVAVLAAGPTAMTSLRKAVSRLGHADGASSILGDKEKR